MVLARTLSVAFATCMLCSGLARGSAIFNFDNDNLGTSTTFTDTDSADGLSATFLSNGDPGGFVLYQSQFQTLTGNVLEDPGPAGQDNLALSVSFNDPLSAVTLDFATSDFSTPSRFTLDGYFNGNLVGTAVKFGEFLPGSTFPEGQIAFSGLFNSLTLSSSATDFAVDNITVTAMPEPGTLPLLAVTLTAIGLPAIRHKRSQSSRVAS